MFAFVLGLSFVLLTIAFRSLVVAAKAIAANLLSVGAAYGLLVLVFQEGFGNELFGFPQVDTIEAWVPLFLFAVLFGLSMDYHVFLLSRIRERYSQTGDNSEAIAYGVGSTGRIITGAALIIIAVFSGFARGDLVMFQQMGFGVAVALLLDATLVRLVLLPAAMELLGERNWYLPSWLSWLPDVRVEGPGTPPARARRTSPSIHLRSSDGRRTRRRRGCRARAAPFPSGRPRRCRPGPRSGRTRTNVPVLRQRIERPLNSSTLSTVSRISSWPEGVRVSWRYVTPSESSSTSSSISVSATRGHHCGWCSMSETSSQIRSTGASMKACFLTWDTGELSPIRHRAARNPHLYSDE